MKQYLDLCQSVLDNGVLKMDRTKTGTISIFGYQMRFPLENGFPLLTTKKVYYKAVIKELLWFISGSSNIQPLVKDGVRIWNEWPYQKYTRSQEYQNESIDQFIEKIKLDDAFASKWGDLGPVYGVQWRNFSGVDQLLQVENELKNNPFSRRLIISAWNPPLIDQMALPPCHLLMQFYVDGTGKKLSLQLYQRSADVFLGVPFNIASYALLLKMFCHVLGFVEGDFVHTVGDAHIYLDHVDQIKLQLERTPLPLCQVKFNRKVSSIVDFVYDDIEIVDYNFHPAILGKVSV